MSVILPHLTKALVGQIDTGGSKSISNRLLIMYALAGRDAESARLSSADDTLVLKRLITQKSAIYDCGKAGTALRFLLALKAYQNQRCIITGDNRMKERPIGILVDVLNEMGACINYTEKEGFPPVEIQPGLGLAGSVIHVDATVSSQFLSALALIGPYLSGGLTLVLKGKMVSSPYFDMTLKMMQHSGIHIERSDGRILIHPGKYSFTAFRVESDWSSASYFFAFCALLPGSQIELYGLMPDSLQGDSMIVRWMEKFGVQTDFTENGIRIRSEKIILPTIVEFDFIDNPDLFQTIAFMCAVLGVQVLCKGLDTLKDKETDRIAAVSAELAKVGVHLVKLPPRMAKKTNTQYYLQEGKANFDKIRINTYADHRMVMAASLLSVAGEVEIEHPQLVKKSYPDFFNHLKLLTRPDK